MAFIIQTKSANIRRTAAELPRGPWVHSPLDRPS